MVEATVAELLALVRLVYGGGWHDSQALPSSPAHPGSDAGWPFRAEVDVPLHRPATAGTAAAA